jgi:RNA-directed DNA polymerase
MHEHGKSDSPVVPARPPNKAAKAGAEAAEERGLAEGNTDGTTHPGRSAGHDAPSGLDRVREVARRDKDARFTALLHHVSLERLVMAYWALSPKAAPGLDGVTWADYGQDLVANLRDLHDRVHSGRYRARPSRRAYIPKADGRLRPLGITVLEDKIVQRAVVEVLNAIYEEDFLGFSYGFRPGRGPHDALDALSVGIWRKKVNWVLDADIRDFFGQLDRAWLRKFLGHRIADKRVLRLVDKWLAAGVIEDGTWSETPQGSPQGASVSPLLANIYLHYVLDLWADWWRRHVAHGDVIIVRFADDFVLGFEDYQDACRFLHDLRERFAKFGLELHPGKTRLIEFGRFAAANRQKRGAGKPETFDFLGLETDAGQAGRGQGPAAATPASAGPGAGPVAGQRGARALRLLRRARQPQGGGGVPHPGDTALAGGAAAPQPALPPGLETHEPPGDPVAAASPRDASLPRRAPWRSYPRQEPSALAAHAGICAGGRP